MYQLEDVGYIFIKFNPFFAVCFRPIYSFFPSFLLSYLVKVSVELRKRGRDEQLFKKRNIGLEAEEPIADEPCPDVCLARLRWLVLVIGMNDRIYQ